MSIDLNKFTEPEELREIARIALAENTALHKRLAKLANKVDTLSQQQAHGFGDGPEGLALQREIAGLKRTLAQANAKHSAPKSERRAGHSYKHKEEKKPQTGGRRTKQPELPVVTELVELPEGELGCPACGLMAKEMAGQHESSEIVTVVRPSYQVVKVLRQKYVRTCECCEDKVLTAPAPLKLVGKGRFSVLFGSSVAVAKYCDHTPLHRQVRQMRRVGLTVTPQTLWDQLTYLHGHAMPTYRAIYDAAFDEPVLGADETGWPMLEKGRRTWQVWCLVSPRLSYFRIPPRKDTKNGVALLEHPAKGPFDGTLVTDGAPVYLAAARELGDSFVRSNCWSHARRYFLTAAQDYPAAEEALGIIGKLYAVEREAKAIPNPQQQLAALARLRTERSTLIAQELYDWMKTHATSWDGSSLNQAIRYTTKRWTELTVFLADARVPLHNNDSEFALRRPVQGKKNFYGAKSRLGTQVAAAFYSLLETARKNKLDPAAYLLTVAMRAIENPGTVTLPWDITSGAVTLLKPAEHR